MLSKGLSSFRLTLEPILQTLVQHKKNNAAKTNVTDAVTATAITTVLWLLFLSAGTFDEAGPEEEFSVGGDSIFELPLAGGKKKLLGDAEGRLKLGSGEGEGAELETGGSTEGAGDGAGASTARFLLGRLSLGKMDSTYFAYQIFEPTSPETRSRLICFSKQSMRVCWTR